jgi:N-acetylmuramoyl-L-alanine amidase
VRTPPERHPLTVIRALLAAGLVATALAVVPSLPHAFEAPKDAILCLVVGAGLTLAAFGPATIVPRPLAGPLLGFLGAGVAASVAASWWSHALVMDGVYTLLFVLGCGALGATAARARLLRVLVVVAAMEVGLAGLQLVLGPLALNLLGSAPRRAYAFGTLGVPNWAGALSAMALPPVLLGPWPRRLEAVLAALLVVGLAVAGSRGAWLAAIGTLLFVCVWSGQWRMSRPLLVGALLGGLVVAATGGTTWHGPGSLSGRLLIWRATAAIIAANPLLGVGPGGFAGAYPAALHAVMAQPAAHVALRPTAFVTHAHDLLLTITAERGLLGLLAFFWFVTALIRLGRRRVHPDWTRTAAGGTLVAFALYGMVDVPLASTPLAMAAWLSAAMLVAPDDVPEAATRSTLVRLCLVLVGLSVVALGLAVVDGDRRLALAWVAAARGDAPDAEAAAGSVRLGPARDEADWVRGLAALGAGDPNAALRLLGVAAHIRPDPDVYYALSTARARAGDLRGALDVLDWLSVTLPGLVGPHLFDAELRRAAGSGGVDDALLRALTAARDTAPNPRLEAFVALAVARRRERHPWDPGAPLVILDPGHGGESPGAGAADAIVEKDVALQLAKPLTAALRARGARVVLSRSRERSVALEDRARLANALAPDLFLSLHANAGRDPEAHGIELYVRTTGVDPQPFPYLSVRDRALLVNALPDGFARAVAARRMLDGCALYAARRLGEALAAVGQGAPAVLPAPFYLLRQVQAPAVLVEAGYLTNPADARRLARPSYRRVLAAAIADGAMRAVAVRCRP